MVDFLREARACTIAQRSAMDQALNEFSAAAPPESPLATDALALSGQGRRTQARNVLYHRGWRLAYLMAATVGDHLQAVGDVAVNPPRIFAHMSLARAALEAAARTHYLLHPVGTVEDRVLRSAALLLASAEHEVTAAAEMSLLPGLAARAAADAKVRHDEISRLLFRADIDVKRKRNGQALGVGWPGSTSPTTLCSPNITVLLRQLLPSKPAAYRVGSGAVHSQPWVLDDDLVFDRERRLLNWTFDPAALAGSVDLAVTASILVLEVFSTMLGADSVAERAAARSRERQVSARVAALL